MHQDSLPGGRCVLSKKWYMSFMTLSTPGPITADLCEHGMMPCDVQTASSSTSTTGECMDDNRGVIPVDAHGPSKIKTQESYVSVDRSSYELLLKLYGGPPQTVKPTTCHICVQIGREYDERRQRESADINMLDKYKIDVDAGDVWHLISTVWLDRWHAFVNAHGVCEIIDDVIVRS